MTTQFTGPKNCAECGAPFTPEIIRAGGSAPATVEVRGHHIMVPGLWRCKGCTVAVVEGIRESRVTAESAVEFLNDVMGPATLTFLFQGPSPEDAAKAVERLAEVVEVQTVLEAVIQLQAEPGGLDFIPECDGKHYRQPGQDKNLAHLN